MQAWKYMENTSKKGEWSVKNINNIISLIIHFRLLIHSFAKCVFIDEIYSLRFILAVAKETETLRWPLLFSLQSVFQNLRPFDLQKVSDLLQADEVPSSPTPQGDFWCSKAVVLLSLRFEVLRRSFSWWCYIWEFVLI